MPKPKPKPKVVNPKPKPKVVNPKPKPKVVKPKPKKKVVNQAPKITKLEPTKPGQHKDLSKVSVGNIIVDKAPKYDKATYLKMAKKFKKYKYTKDKVIGMLGPLPAGVTWDSI